MQRFGLGWVAYTCAVTAMLATAVLSIYVGARSPLSDEEIDAVLARIEAQTHTPGGRHDMRALRRFLEEDDGRPFYTVNLYAFYEKARYAEEERTGVTGREAYDRFSAAMIRLLAARASHPVFGSDWIQADATGWDRIVIVRYRSRRDIADLFASDAFAVASADKWAALERNDRLLVQALHIPELHIPAGLLIAAGTVVFVVARNRRGDGLRASTEREQ